MNQFFKTTAVQILLLSLYPMAGFSAEADRDRGKQTAENAQASPSNSILAQEVRDSEGGHKNTVYTIDAPLPSAILNEDIAAYSKEMSRLWNSANLEEFLEAVLFRDEFDNSIFHLYANVRSPEARPFFAKEMRTLIHLFTGGLESGMVLGGEEIHLPSLESSLAAQGISPVFQLMGKAPELYSRKEIIPDEAISIKEHLARLKQKPLKQFIQSVYARDSKGRTFMDWFASFYSSSVQLPGLSASEEASEKWQKTLNKLNKAINDLFVTKNIEGKTPIDIAYESENPEAYQVLKNFSSPGETELDGFYRGIFEGTKIAGMGSSIGLATAYVIAGVLQYFINGSSPPMLSSFPHEWFSIGITGGVSLIALGALGDACYQTVRNAKKKRLEKKLSK